MQPETIRRLLESVRAGSLDVGAAMERLRHLPMEELSHATLDHHRALRRGFPEVVYCQGKTPAQAADILARLARHGGALLATRASAGHWSAVRRKVRGLRYAPGARCIYRLPSPAPKRRDDVLIVCAGTSDLPVADEADVTLRTLGVRAARLTDVGVAGLHRLLGHLNRLAAARVILAVAGMEGALPSVIGGLVSCPVIGVPTSVGYGSGAGGTAALHAMLNSCSPGLAVVNIDNGFGAAYLAATILK